MRKILSIALIACTTVVLTAQTPRSDGAPATTPKPAVQPRGATTTAGKSTKLAPARPAPTSPTTTARTRSGSTQTRSTTTMPANSGSSRNSAVNPNRTTTTTARPNTTTTAKAAPRIGRKGRVIPAVPVKIKWMTLEEALEKSKTDKRKIFVDVYTDWCGWCKRMNDSTFTDPFVAQYVNDHYYPVRFNAEQQQDIVFKGRTYHFKRNGPRGCHELAAEWLNNRLSYPTVVFLDENLDVIQPIPGFQDPAKMEAILNYYATNSHYTTPWDTYEKRFANGE